MKLTKTALEAIDNGPDRMRIALALGCSEASVKRYIKNNDDELTKAVALKTIKEVTGLKEREILETVKANAI